MAKKYTEEEIMAKYALSERQIKEIEKNIIAALTYEKEPSANPLAIVVGGQSGAGKTALINYTSTMSSDREFVMIDNDYFRGFHPKANEIRSKYPALYTAATDQIGLGITSNIIQYFMENHYDIILHQTLKNNRIADDAITKFRDAGYTVGVRAFAVPYFESKMSQIERCLGQIEKLGFCRYVRKVDHDAAVAGLPGTVGYIEESGKYDFIEIFKRGTSIKQPNLVYAGFNPKTKDQTLLALANCEDASHDNNKMFFKSAQEAVEQTIEMEAQRVALTLDKRIEEAENSPFNNPEMQEHIDELKGYFQTYKLEHPELFSEETSAPTDTITEAHAPSMTDNK